MAQDGIQNLTKNPVPLICDVVCPRSPQSTTEQHCLDLANTGKDRTHQWPLHFFYFTFTSLLDTTLLAKYFQSPFTDIGLQLSKATDGFISHTNI